MAKLDEVLKLVRLYEEKYRHPSLTRFSVSNKYDLFPGKENMENCWPQCYPYADRPGVYLIMDDKDNVLYIGKSSVAIGRRLGSYFCYDGAFQEERAGKRISDHESSLAPGLPPPARAPAPAVKLPVSKRSPL